jgi:hypothetical protein
VSAPTPAPAPAPNNPPETARPPGLLPQAARPSARTPTPTSLVTLRIVLILPYTGTNSGQNNTALTKLPHFSKKIDDSNSFLGLVKGRARLNLRRKNLIVDRKNDVACRAEPEAERRLEATFAAGRQDSVCSLQLKDELDETCWFDGGDWPLSTIR